MKIKELVDLAKNLGCRTTASPYASYWSKSNKIKYLIGRKTLGVVRRHPRTLAIDQEQDTGSFDGLANLGCRTTPSPCSSDWS